MRPAGHCYEPHGTHADKEAESELISSFPAKHETYVIEFPHAAVAFLELVQAITLLMKESGRPE